jgi:23S rRNA U2552 (ribose-2'-O)-methylase RlmE/FtsJ
MAILRYSLYAACKEQKLIQLRNDLAEIVSDLTEQYSSNKIESSYLVDKVRSQHAFQISLALSAYSMLAKINSKKVTIVDIGDSSGTHLQYLQSICGSEKIHPIAVNLDPIAVQKIKAKNIESFLTKAEYLHQHPEFGGNAEIFLSYEMLEHLFDPISFLHKMATNSVCEFFVITVPYCKKSRVALDLVRYPKIKKLHNAETTHIFELSPNDWNLVFKFSGWTIVKEVKYTQYPIKSPFTVLRYLWRWYDFDGFYGVILKKDDSFSKKYLDW